MLGGAHEHFPNGIAHYTRNNTTYHPSQHFESLLHHSTPPPSTTSGSSSTVHDFGTKKRLEVRRNRWSGSRATLGQRRACRVSVLAGHILRTSPQRHLSTNPHVLASTTPCASRVKGTRARGGCIKTNCTAEVFIDHTTRQPTSPWKCSGNNHHPRRSGLSEAAYGRLRRSRSTPASNFA